MIHERLVNVLTDRKGNPIRSYIQGGSRKNIRGNAPTKSWSRVASAEGGGINGGNMGRDVASPQN